jgi:hypothetical protein
MTDLSGFADVFDNSSPLNWDVKRIWNLFANRFPIEEEEEYYLEEIEEEEYYLRNKTLADRFFELTGEAEGQRDDDNDKAAQLAIDEFDRLWLAEYGEAGLNGWIGMNTPKPAIS